MGKGKSPESKVRSTVTRGYKLTTRHGDANHKHLRVRDTTKTKLDRMNDLMHNNISHVKRLDQTDKRKKH